VTTRTDSTTDRPGADASSPTEVPAPGWRQILARAWKEQGDDLIGTLAGGIAYFAFLTLFPALTAALSIWALVAGSADSAVEQVQSLTSQLGGDLGTTIEEQVERIAGTAPSALGFSAVASIVLALWSASGGMAQMIAVLNVAYDETDDRGYVKKRGFALLLALGAILFVLVALLLIAAVPVVLTIVDLGPAANVALQVGRFVILAGAILVALAVLYRVAPHRDDPKVRWASPGAVFATVVWLLASVAFSFYVSNFGNYTATYGALAGAVILLLWLYLTSYIILFGAEINAEAERQTRQDTTHGDPRPMGERHATAADTEPGAPGRRTGDDS
jgi:membrane protein